MYVGLSSSLQQALRLGVLRSGGVYVKFLVKPLINQKIYGLCDLKCVLQCASQCRREM